MLLQPLPTIVAAVLVGGVLAVLPAAVAAVQVGVAAAVVVVARHWPGAQHDSVVAVVVRVVQAVAVLSSW